MHQGLSELVSNYEQFPEMEQMIKDVDVYLTVPRKLLDPAATPLSSDNASYINELIGYINAEQFRTIPFFSSVPRKIDFSQFKPRGHYTDIYNPQLADYFKAMIWLGKIEIYLIAPKSFETPPTFRDMQRQIIDAVLIFELIKMTNNHQLYSEMEIQER